MYWCEWWQHWEWWLIQSPWELLLFGQRHLVAIWKFYSANATSNVACHSPLSLVRLSAHVARQLLKTMITFSDVHPEWGRNIWSCNIFAAQLNKQHHQSVLSCGLVSHLSQITPMIPCPLIPPGTQDTQSCWSSKSWVSGGTCSRIHTRFLSITTKIHKPVHGWFRRSPILESLGKPCGKTAAQNSMIPVTVASSPTGDLDAEIVRSMIPITVASSPTADLDAEIAHCYANPQDILAADHQLLNNPISKVHKLNQISSPYTPLPLSCRAPRSAVYYTPILRPISSQSYTHWSSPTCSISCTHKSHAASAIVKMDPAWVE